MPELPEVETVRRGLASRLEGKTFLGAVSRVAGLRLPVPAGLHDLLAGQRLHAVERRAKYLLLRCDGGTLILHLGMSGYLRVVDRDLPPGRHDHLDLLFDDGQVLRFNDARRFGLLLWTTADPQEHPLLVGLGPEPFAGAFTGDYLHERARGRTVPVKAFIMDQRLVVGVGNIYANEALFLSGIHPARATGRISRDRYLRLADIIRTVLAEAIAAGGTTLRDFSDSDGKPGYFALSLRVYGREGEPCPRCGHTLRQERIGGRSSFFCSRCQH
ncbi:bifunctional DNA-formamidopyrimidine glycosylase/DNA-(apurinic or apyrimidinic site) lyase [Trichloromonas sp.]|uniref:bifunctional DNA-formamidopyrimidine glycosylase/DNA-(apurinic or apyrimidinic site) lyase n=1 Tax=Trichloromonas sp. TaxID=3069249 RepID=UPI002A3815AA|nr:bifunctional DNA-formamidopyrimidine glycosylase/DNA-(apurinic or apyrimidinic site) lyase [Trichloromonas sp.]